MTLCGRGRLPLPLGGDADVHMASAGQLLVSGQPERMSHLQVPSFAHQLRLHRHGARGKRRRRRAGPGRCLGGQCPPPTHFPGKLGQLEARPCAGFQLLPVQLGLK